MRLEAIKSFATEIFLETKDGAVTVNPWSNQEGANVMLTTKDGAVKMAGCLRWEEIDCLLAALAVARSTP